MQKYAGLVSIILAISVAISGAIGKVMGALMGWNAIASQVSVDQGDYSILLAIPMAIIGALGGRVAEQSPVSLCLSYSNGQNHNKYAKIKLSSTNYR